MVESCVMVKLGISHAKMATCLIADTLASTLVFFHATWILLDYSATYVLVRMIEGTKK